MLTLQEISDRLEIQDLMVRYAHAVDTREWTLFKELFTDDAVIDYSAFGGPCGSVDEVTSFLQLTMPLFSATQHLVANCAVTLDGDRATARTMCHNPMAVSDSESVLLCGLWYVDTLVRTPDGWRLSERSEDKAYSAVLNPQPSDEHS